MTPMMITLLIAAGIASLIAIGFLNNMVEANKVARTREKFELADRLRRCAEISETFPGQLITPEVKLMLYRIELHMSKKLLPLDKANAALKERIPELEALVAQGDQLQVSNPPSPIQTEERAKEVSYQLEIMHHQVIRATQDGLFAAGESRHWVNQIRHILVLLHIEFFNNLGQQAFQAGEPGHARLAFERGVQYLKKQPEPSVYSEQLRYLEKLLARANDMVMNDIKHHVNESSELTQGLDEESAKEEAQWKKRAIYD
ncbi:MULTISPECIES: hypothetical protein [unclassified Pseudomonas]|uniref:hypothetical protein n=1 Tax=unclassified Pseudomonas TaxID=196821 RepID=UPI000BC823F8|nr:MULTISPECIES: hypothetical protein [unclassified Pseudomonas]PVZ09238.1 hypothetical protein F474_04416 [Pseudomonas sp. URIL14HWK12:I12]PVZ21317.1 hypothetical protein F470_04408 [Pseudomonas sp. URIL14HWK12:I10]PVZ30170.1 hypothetical protein F472_04410 [Pseudomonas sp. URIL14HWK12:I11]SNZ18706.1 hypothetical protein SAMN05660463_04284 [Pseudomonas sp. URIL14HWK12:I9]